MKITVRTEVSSDLKTVKMGFTKNLFLALNPPFPKVDLLEFGGCKTGDVVSLRLHFPFFTQIWKSEITEDSHTTGIWYFIDEGKELPFFLKHWRHKHIVAGSSRGAQIIDEIKFSTGFILTDFLVYPVLYVQFLYRKPIYKKWFKKEKQPI